MIWKFFRCLLLFANPEFFRTLFYIIFIWNHWENLLLYFHLQVTPVFRYKNKAKAKQKAKKAVDYF